MQVIALEVITSKNFIQMKVKYVKKMSKMSN